MARSSSRRWLLSALGTTSVAALAGCSSLLGDDEGTAHGGDPPSSPTEGPPESSAGTPNGSLTADGPVATAPLPTTASDYAVLGREAASRRATLYGAWKCPHTRAFVQEWLPPLVNRYVASGDLQIRFRAVRFQTDEPYGGDESRANQAGLAVWETAPDSYWAYFEHVFENQPPETTEWATTERLASYARAVGIDESEPVREAIEAERYSDRRRASRAAFDELGLDGVPRFQLGDEVTAPTVDPQATKDQLSRTIDDA